MNIRPAAVPPATAPLPAPSLTIAGARGHSCRSRSAGLARTTRPPPIDDSEACLKATGHVIVAGDAVNLPWSTTYRRRHAPHWFVVDGRHPAGGWHVTDPFCALDEHGEQHPWSGVVPDAAFPAILRTAALAPEQALRERNPAVRAAAEAASAWARVPVTVWYAAESVRRGRRRISALLAMLTEVE